MFPICMLHMYSTSTHLNSSANLHDYCLALAAIARHCQEFSQSFKGHELPRLVATWAPVEASFVLTTFGVLAGLASPEANTPIHQLVLANVLRLLATLIVGLLFGAISAFFMNSISDQEFGPGIFTGSSSERLLMLLATTLWVFGLGLGEEGNELVPMGFAPGSMFQPELLVIVTGQWNC